jgi:PKD repeat protein
MTTSIIKPIGLLLIITSAIACSRSPKACFTFSKSSAKIDDTITLNNCSTNYYTFKWELPKGAVNVSNSNLRVRLQDSGKYTAKIIVSSQNGLKTDALEQSIDVSNK